MIFLVQLNGKGGMRNMAQYLSKKVNLQGEAILMKSI